MSGLLFTAPVLSTTPTSYYGYRFGTLNPSIYQVSVTAIGGTTVLNINADYSVTVTPAATPEPGSVALLIGMSVTGAGFLARRRRSSLTAA